VCKGFVDYDGDPHELGEEWTFVGSSFLPYESGWSLFVVTAEGEWHLRLWDDLRGQEQIVDALREYVKEVQG
jgi:hypothetical protein